MRYIIFCIFIPAAHLCAQTIAIKADRLISGDKEILNPVVLVKGHTILAITTDAAIPDSAQLIDLSGHTILPGLIDVHTHVLVDGSEYFRNLYVQSASFRAIRAVSYLDISLNNGFTTIRDVCSEGAGYADVDIAKAVDAKLIRGPKVIPSGRGLAATGQYMPRPASQNWDHEFPAGTQYVTGADECRRAVREQISKGAKWIKLYIDWDVVTLTEQEVLAVIEEAKRFNVQVAVHATTSEGIALAIKCGAKSVEHGDGFDDALIQQAIKSRVYWSPTLTVYDHYKIPSEKKYAALKSAYMKGLKIVLGSDVGSFPWTINQAKELELYVTKIGMRPIDALKSGTVYAAELLGKEKEIGQIVEGFTADIIAIKGNPLLDITLVQNVDFVMKSGMVVKRP